MQRKLSFRQRLFLHFSIIFAGFTILVLIFQFEREKSFRRSNFEVTLNDITELTHNYIQKNGIYENGRYLLIDSLVTIVPESNIRITVIEKNGNVLYDSEVLDSESMENHLYRPEIQEAFHAGFGSNIRESETTGSSYYYYARLYPKYLVRTAALYNVQVKDYLHVERLFIAYLVLLFLIVALALMILTRRFSETITKLKEFSIRIRSGKEPVENIQFPSDELGVISGQITSIYKDLNKARLEISAEREKLFSHLNALNEGIAFYDADKKPILTNQQFIQLLNLISDTASGSAEKVFDIAELEPVVRFINTQLAETEPIDPDRLPAMEIVLQISARYFTVKCMFFSDRSFEIVIADTTKLEKRKLIKQQMTSNIAHELRTPVASVLGYLETIQQKSVPKETRKHFIKRAYAQAERLSDLVEDIASLNKIMEAGNTFTFGPLNVVNIVSEVVEHLQMKLEANRIIVQNDLPEKLVVNGNASLLYSVFYNLFENAIKYGGEDIEIHLTNYLEDKKFLYFSFANTGEPIEEVHLTRLFERFYRIDDGRSRHRGGTGLGLAIVKNAIELHKGKITVRNYKEEKGVEFLFTLSK
jgi:two-component system OmpR family sensor kinase/two-component system phosphate regulon sensor histidine kinase PhoR